MKCEELGGASVSKKSFKRRVDWLADHDDRPSFDREHWHRWRKFRYERSHHSRRMLVMPAAAKQFLGEVAIENEGLFKPEAGEP